MTIGSQIEQMRRFAGLTQAQLSERSGVNQAIISALERGKRNCTIATLESLAEGLQMDLRYTFTPKDWSNDK